jgi:hypothetical protein
VSAAGYIRGVLTDRDEETSASELTELEANLDESWTQLEAGDEISAEAAILAVAAIR